MSFRIIVEELFDYEQALSTSPVYVSHRRLQSKCIEELGLSSHALEGVIQNHNVVTSVRFLNSLKLLLNGKPSDLRCNVTL